MDGLERHGFASRRCRNNLSSPFLYLTALFSQSYAQAIIGSVPLTLTTNPVTLSAHILTSTASIGPTMIHSSLSSPAASPTGGSTDQAPTDLFPATVPTHEGETHDEAVFNFYFLFLVLFGVMVAALLWWLQRQKKRRKERMRLGGQHALARDMEGWVGTRRLMHGRYGRHHRTTPARHEEGLNEHGEAPPPYQPKSNHVVGEVEVHAAQDVPNNVTIPLRTLPREGLDRSRPPGYRDTLEVTPLSSARPPYP